jgi:CxxC motif-containing protein (DUF1111 family)
MNESSFHAIRRRIGLGMSGLTVLGMTFILTPGLPVFFGPRADPAVKAAGLVLFQHEWQPHDPMASGDGLGPVFNARSCAECHFQGGVGGGGDNRHNVLAFEALPTQDRPEVKGGLIHKFAVTNRYLEDDATIHAFFPIVPNGIRVEGGCQVFTRDFDPVVTQTVNSTALFGTGWVDRISGKTILHNYARSAAARIGRELDGQHEGTVPGRIRLLSDGRVGKFGWKGQFATLEEFVAAACANELGLGNPRMEQARPMVRWKYPTVDRDLDRSQFRALVAFVDTLPRPIEAMPDLHDESQKAERGKALFREVGCAACHTPDVGGVAGIYTDFALHRLDDRSTTSGYRETPPVPMPHDAPLPEEWKTPALWGVADSAPYFHDGGSPTLEAAVLRHHGDAETVTATYRRLAPDDRSAILAFLGTLRTPSDALPRDEPSPSRIALAR